MDDFSPHQNQCLFTYPTNLRSVENFGAYVSLMGYPKGTLHIFLGLPSEPKGEGDSSSKKAFVFESEKSDSDFEEVYSGPSPLADYLSMVGAWTVTDSGSVYRLDRI